MLKKRTNAEIGTMPVSSPSPGPVSVEKKTIIGEAITIEGIIRGDGNLVIEGSLKGNIELEKHQLTVGPKGQVEAEIHAGNVIVSGRVNGNIKALGKVSITKDANFSGEIKARGISIEDGAYLKAVIELDRENTKKTGSPIKPADQAASAPGKGPVNVSAEAGKGKYWLKKR